MRRLGELRQLVTSRGIGMRRTDDGLLLRFATRARVQDEIARWIVVESECWPSLRWTMTLDAGLAHVDLVLHGSAAARDVLIERVPAIVCLPRVG